MPASTKKLSMKQLIASLAVESDADAGETVYVIRTPRANVRHNSTDPEKCICYGCHKGSGLTMYGVSFTDGVAVVTNGIAKAQTIREKVSDTEVVERPMTAKELVEKITSEWPDYTAETLA